MTTGLKVPSNYLQLINAFPPRPISNETELLATQKQINLVIDRPNLTTDDRDYLKILGMLVYEYESQHEVFPSLKGEIFGGGAIGDCPFQHFHCGFNAFLNCVILWIVACVGDRFCLFEGFGFVVVA